MTEVVRRDGPVPVRRDWRQRWRQGQPCHDVPPGTYVYRPVLPTLAPAQASAQVFMAAFDEK